MTNRSFNDVIADARVFGQNFHQRIPAFVADEEFEIRLQLMDIVRNEKYNQLPFYTQFGVNGLS